MTSDSNTIPTIVAHGQRFVSQCITSHMQRAEFRVLATVGDLDALEVLEVDETPALCLLGCFGSEAAFRRAHTIIRTRFPDCKIALVDLEPHETLAQAAELLGVNAYLTLDLTPELILSSLRLVMAGADCFTSSPGDVPKGTSPCANQTKLNDVKFTPREREVLGMIVKGQLNKVIAYELDIAESTVKAHLNAIFTKTETSNRTELSYWAMKRGYADSDPIETLKAS